MKQHNYPSLDDPLIEVVPAVIGDIEELDVMGAISDDETCVDVDPFIMVMVIFDGDSFVDVCDVGVASEPDGDWEFFATCSGVGDVEMSDGHDDVWVIFTSCLAVKFPAKNLKASVLLEKDLKKDPV